jgi:hypothetical protein
MRPNARIEDILLTLSDPEEYVRGILENFYTGKFNREVANVRIGISGSGIFPHYCIYQGEGDHVLALADGTILGYEKRAVFHGRSHNLILEDEFIGVSWSLSKASFAEVQSLLGIMRASKKSN